MVQQELRACFACICLSWGFWEGVCGNCIKGRQSHNSSFRINKVSDLITVKIVKPLHPLGVFDDVLADNAMHFIFASQSGCKKRQRTLNNLTGKSILKNDTTMKDIFHEMHRLTLSSNQNLSIWTAALTSQIAFVLVCSRLLSLKQRY